MTYMQPRASYRPIGRQPFRPGQWQGFKGMSRNTTYIQNNFFGSSYNSGYNYNSCFGYGNYNNYGNYGCNCGGGNKFMNWMMGIGLGTTLLGGIFKLFGIGGNNNNQTIQGNETTRRHDNDDSSTRTRRRENSQANPVDEADESEETDEAEEVTQNQESEETKNKKTTFTDILKVQKQEVKNTTSYPVNYGDTWANVITAKYKDENGNPISFDDAKELWTKLKAECGTSKNADGMPPNIELPNEFKNYKLDINGKVKANTDFENSNYKKYDGKGFTPSTTTIYTATGTVNGKSIGSVSGSKTEVSAKLIEQGFTAQEINEAMKNGEIKITKDKEE